MMRMYLATEKRRLRVKLKLPPLMLEVALLRREELCEDPGKQLKLHALRVGHTVKILRNVVLHSKIFSIELTESLS